MNGIGSTLVVYEDKNSLFLTTATCSIMKAALLKQLKFSQHLGRMPHLSCSIPLAVSFMVH